MRPRTSSVAATPSAHHGWYTASVTTPNTAESSATLAPMFVNGSGEALSASRSPDLTRCESRAVPPPKVV
jgi:hypothetical protein